MFRPACIAIVSVLTVLGAAVSTAPEKSSPAVLDAALRAALEKNHIPGAIVVATDRQRVFYRNAFGMADVANDRPMTPFTIFRIASMTKPITSVALMQLVEQGKVGLDDPASKYVPELGAVSVFESFDPATHAYVVHPASRPITVRHLLTHTSGLAYNFMSPIIRDFKPRAGEQYAAGPLLFEPGQRWHYGQSTDWVGQIVERVSGKTLEAYFLQKIFTPLRMTDTFFNIPEDKEARLVTLHRLQKDGSFKEQPNQPFRPVTRFNGGGGLSSTAADYIRFVQMLLNDGELSGSRILSAESVNVMARNQIGDVGVPALKTANPEVSNDFTFINDGKDKFGFGFLINTEAVPGKRSAGSLTWAGVNNSYFWIDRVRGIGGVIMMQVGPFADPHALDVLDVFERGVYQLAPD